MFYIQILWGFFLKKKKSWKYFYSFKLLYMDNVYLYINEIYKSAD